MPTYTYACKQCGHRFDQRQSFTDPALTDCPACDGALRKVLNSVGIVFKGSGFYRTDSRASSNGALTGAAARDKAASSSSATASSGSGSGGDGASGSAKDTGSSKSSGASNTTSSKQPAAVH
jgi:putative FmdB family regulatory protein